MITFQSRSAHVNYWRKSDNTCRKPWIDCCSAFRHDVRYLRKPRRMNAGVFYFALRSQLRWPGDIHCDP